MSVEEYKKWVIKEIRKYYWITPSACALKSFYVCEVDKPPTVTIQTFLWLRSIAEQTIKDYKSTPHE